jgi:hypothetical protein
MPSLWRMPGWYKLLLDSDREEFGGQGRVADIDYPCNEEGQLTLYLPSRVAVVMKKKEK